MRRISSFLALYLAFCLLAGCSALPLPPPLTATATTAPTALTSSTPLPAPTDNTVPRVIRTARPRTPVPSLTPAPTATATLPPSPPGGRLSAVYRSGQTFLTWDELPGDGQERYRVYRSPHPIRQIDDLNQASVLAELAQGSASFYANRFHNPGTHAWEPRFFNNLVIQNRGAELPDGKGLLVWTLSLDDFNGQSGGQGYYAVTYLAPDGTETLLPGYTTGPIDERQADPLPVETRAQDGEGSHVMIQYMDLNTWNPTFHAPGRLNDFYGLHPTDPRFDGSLQYAFDYVIFDPVCPAGVDKVPAVLVLKDQARSPASPPVLDPQMAGWCAYRIYPTDPGDTAWFGFAEFHDYRQQNDPQPGMTVANFTEQRLLRMVYDLVRQPTGPAVDPNRIYVIGDGVSGDRAIALATHYGRAFAAAYASQPMNLNPSSSDYYSQAALPHLQSLWGLPVMGLPVSLSAPAPWISALQEYNGAWSWDWRGYGSKPARQLGESAAPVGMDFQRNKAAWKTEEGIPQVLNGNRQTWSGYVVENAGVTPLGFPGLPPGIQSADGIPFAGLRVTMNESIPAFSNNSLDRYTGVSDYGGYNATVQWSSSWYPWNGSPLDAADRWEISLCAVSPDPYGARVCGTGQDQTVDVTPRRLQNFIILPAMRIRWQNYRLSDNLLLASGVVTAAEDGSVTIRGVRVLPEGNRLALTIIPAGHPEIQQ